MTRGEILKNLTDNTPITGEELENALYRVGIDKNKIRLLVFDTVGSTNTVAKELASEGVPTLVVANGQTGGRGRLGRSFACPDGAGAYMSILVYPKIPATEASRLTCLAAVAVARAVGRLSGLSPFIKWVNDLYIGDKKLAGILTEGSADGDGLLSYAVIGIGINVHSADLGEFSEIATSIDGEGGMPTKRSELIAEILAELFPMLEAEDTTPYFKEYTERARPIVGKTVTVRRGDESFFAVVEKIEDDGRLTVRAENGGVVSLGSGEVTLSFKR